MTCTTFLNEIELNVPTSNKDINSLLSEVRTLTGENWQIIERTWIVKNKIPFIKPKQIKYYEIYIYIGGIGPWQAINFYRDNSSSSINFGATAEIMVTYLYGILVGLNSTERNKWKNQ